jgi:hypothetical protein
MRGGEGGGSFVSIPHVPSHRAVTVTSIPVGRVLFAVEDLGHILRPSSLRCGAGRAGWSLVDAGKDLLGSPRESVGDTMRDCNEVRVVVYEVASGAVEVELREVRKVCKVCKVCRMPTCVM